jgi:hypothetical protein
MENVSPSETNQGVPNKSPQQRCQLLYTAITRAADKLTIIG